MLLKIDGVDITHMVYYKGLTWGEIDIHSEDSGRDMGGTMHATIIDSKVRINVPCKPLTQQEASLVLTTIKHAPPLVVEYDDPVSGSSGTINCYCGDRNCEFLMQCNGVKWWQNLKFELIEQ